MHKQKFVEFSTFSTDPKFENPTLKKIPQLNQSSISQLMTYINLSNRLSPSKDISKKVYFRAKWKTYEKWHISVSIMSTTETITQKVPTELANVGPLRILCRVTMIRWSIKYWDINIYCVPTIFIKLCFGRKAQRG